MSEQIQPLKTPTAKRRVIWVQNKPNHYFVEMLDSLNRRGNVEYFGVFLFPTPVGSTIFQVPANSPHVFLGDPKKHGGPVGYKRLGAEARDYVKNLEFCAAIVGGYDSRFKRWILRYCRSQGIPTALFVDSNIRTDRGRSFRKKLKRFAKRIFLHRIIHQVDRVIPCNRYGAVYWRYYGCPNSKVTRSTYFCAVDVPAALAVNREELFARYKLNTDCKLIFTAARLVPAKALHLMVEAFTKSGLAQKGWAWAVAGDGPLRQDLERMSEKLNGNAIRFLGIVPPVDIPPLMAQSEFFVLPSVYEPHGIVVEEAMAVGTPVIANRDCGAARDLVRQAKTGWLYSPSDAPSLLLALREAVGTERKTAHMAALCREEFTRWYTRYDPLVRIPQVVGAAVPPQ